MKISDLTQQQRVLASKVIEELSDLSTWLSLTLNLTPDQTMILIKLLLENIPVTFVSSPENMEKLKIIAKEIKKNT